MSLHPRDCRCWDLKQVFGDHAPRCNICRSETQKAELVAAGWVPTVKEYILPFRDCGVPVITVLGHEQMVWVPCWASTLQRVLNGSTWCGPILTRAAFDEEFREACLTIAVLPDLEVIDLCLRLRDYAKANGVE